MKIEFTRMKRSKTKLLGNFLSVSLFLIGLSFFQDMRAQHIEKDSTHWVGEWADDGNLHYSFHLHLFPLENGKMTGYFEWKLIWSSVWEHIPKVGAVATEYLIGYYDVENETLNLQGIRQKDPVDIISMDIYTINVRSEGKKMLGINRKPGNYQGRLYGELVEEKPAKTIVQAKKITPEPVPAKSPIKQASAKTAVVEKPIVVEKTAPDTKPAPTSAIAEMEGREIITKQEISAKDEEIRIQIYDNSIVDGDVISVIWNGEWVMRYYKVVTAPKTLVLKLQKGENTLVMHAENMGRYPPNTAAITVAHSGKTETIILNSTMGSSEALKFVRE